MRVLIFSLAYLPFIGGAELAIKEITDHITDVQFDMITVNLNGRQQPIEELGNVKVYRLGSGRRAKYSFPLKAFEKAEALHREHSYDAVWAIMANQAGLAALQFKKTHPDIRYILTLQEGDSLKRIWSRTWFMRKTYKDIYRTADAITAISTFLANRAVQYGFKKPVHIIPNGVDVNRFKKDFSDEQRTAMRQKLGLEPTDRVIVTASRLVHKNGVDTLIRAVRDLPVKLLILGQGNKEIQLKALAQEIGVRHHVLFLGHIDQKDLPDYLKLADVFVRASRSEGLGSAFLEAMAAGVPVIGTNVGGIPDFLRDGENGLFCQVNNPSDLMGRIQLLLSDETLRQKLITNGRNLIAENYDWQSIARQTKDVLQHG